MRFEGWLAKQTINSDQIRWLRMMESQIRANVGDLESVELYHFTLPPFSFASTEPLR